jgi:hypothetical protein
MKAQLTNIILTWSAAVLLPLVAWAGNDDLMHDHHDHAKWMDKSIATLWQ